jgi:hypothetical protein
MFRCWSAGRARARRQPRAAASLSDIGQTVAENFGTKIANGSQFLTGDYMRKPIMAGNWKMYKNPAETTVFFEKFRPLVEKAEHCEDRDLPALHEYRRGRCCRAGHAHRHRRAGSVLG